MNKEKAKLALKHLIDRYDNNKHLKDFIGNEKQISRSLIEPFIRDVLGWDIEDPQEFKVEVPASGKRVDILVCLNGVTQFIVEAKSLTQEIVDYNDFYKQTISYAHSKEKTFAILTNFKNFIILRCDVEVDNPLKAAVKIINIENYTNDDFDLLYNFSKQIWVEKGEENPLYLKLANFKRRAKVDVELLENLKEWRQSIINNIKKHPRQNKYDFSDDKTRYEVEEEIQRFIDRIIFICFTEDRGFVDAELKSLIELKKDKHFESQSWLLDKIRGIFKKYWNDYNSDLFRVGKCDEFFIEDSVISKILIDLRKPKDKLPYDFASIEADILGKTYENFIGHVISGEKRLKEKESKGKRKSEGIYYTPTYIVDYIVRNTVKEYIKGKSFASINKVKILDPACGSGSFLIKAFDALVDESKNILKRELNYDEKKNLMLNCIHGVDKDERAVDICKLNLSLKLAERGQKLPELHNNIKCGDSLIDDKEIAGYKAFKWEEEFKEIISNGGFDVVIGNPPYFNLQTIEDNNESNYFEHKYKSYRGKADILYLFIENINSLLKDKGILGLIVANYFLKSHYADKLRNFVVQNYEILKIIDFGSNKIFEDANVDTCIIKFKKSNRKNERYLYGLLLNRSRVMDFLNESLKNEEVHNKNYKLLFNNQINKNDSPWQFDETRISDTTHISEICNIGKGAATGMDDIFVVDKKLNKGLKFEQELIDYLVDDSSIDRYNFKLSEKVLIRTKRGTEISKYPNIKKYLESNKSKLHKRYAVQKEGLKWYEIVRYNEDLFSNNVKGQIYAYYRSTHNKFAYSDKRFVTLTTTFVLTSKNKYHINLKYLVAILNSKFIENFSRKNAKKMGSCFEYSSNFIGSIPIKIIPIDKQQPFIKLADKMLSLNKKLQEIGDKNTLEKQKLEQEIKKTDNEMDELIYQLYGITEEEKKIIEESLK